jgi:uncharacterized membrane protein
MNTSEDLNENTTSENSQIDFPGALSCYGYGWEQMKKYFPELLLIVIVAWLLSIPSLGLQIHDLENLLSKLLPIDPFFPEFEGFGMYVIFAIVFIFLIEGPVEYGVAYAALRAARNERVETKNIFTAFNNYKNAVLAYILVIMIIVSGIILLIIPGIVFLCKLAFVPYLIVDKKMDAVPAIKESWRMTGGHTVIIFLMFVLAFFLSILGLILVGVGLIFAVMWIEPSFAHLYHTVSSSQTKVSLTETTA